MPSLYRKTITIRPDQEEFLQRYPSINLSGVTRKALDDLRD
jgi:hypothetical protein